MGFGAEMPLFRSSILFTLGTEPNLSGRASKSVRSQVMFVSPPKVQFDVGVGLAYLAPRVFEKIWALCSKSKCYDR